MIMPDRCASVIAQAMAKHITVIQSSYMISYNIKLAMKVLMNYNVDLVIS